MTPWTNDLTAKGTFPPSHREIPCFPLDTQMLREQSLSAKGRCRLQPLASRLGSSAATKTVYTLTASAPCMSVFGQAKGQTTMKRFQNPVKGSAAATKTGYTLTASAPCVSVPSQAQGQTAMKRFQNPVKGIQPVAREKRFRKTVEALQKCGLWDIAMTTGNLIKRNSELQTEIEQFRTEAASFLKAVVQNPENKELVESWTSGAPSALGHRVYMTDGSESEATRSTSRYTRSRSKVSDGNSSTTSGYASYTESGLKQTCYV